MPVALLTSLVTAVASSTMAAVAPPVTPARAEKLRNLVTTALREDDSLDVPGVLWLEHLNLLVGPREEAEQFYCDFLGCVREPGRSWHVNMGSQQFHLAEAPTASNQHVLTGSVGLAVPSLDALRGRIPTAARELSHTRFAVADHGDHLAIVDPWGSNFICRDARLPADEASVAAADGAPPKMVAAHVGLDESFAVRANGQPGIRCVEFRVRPGTARRIGQFYEHMLQCKVSYGANAATVLVGPSVHLVFHEVEGAPLTDAQERAQAGPGGGVGLHICIYIAGFRAAFDRLQARGLVATNPRFARLDTCDDYQQAVASRTFRFAKIVDLESGEELLELEHEVRAQRHFQFFKRTHYPEGSGL